MLRFLIVFIFSAFTLLAQDPDTLLNPVLRMENDTQKVNELYAYGYYFMDADIRLASVCVKNCETAAKNSKSLRHLSKSYNLSGIFFCNRGNYKKALDYFEKYMEVNTTLNDTLLLAYGFTNFGNIYLRLKQFQKAESCFLSAVNYYNILGSDLELANNLINLGVVNQKQNRLDAALQNYEKALAIGKELNEYDIKAICLNNLAEVFSDKKDYEKALAYNYDALELRDMMGSDIDMTDSYLSIAEVALKQNNLELAKENLKLALILSIKLDYYEGYMIWHKLVSEFYSKKGNYESAYEQLKRYQQMNDSFLQIQTAESTYEFSEIKEPSFINKPSVIRNVWLLSLLSVILIIVPFVLIRYKR